MKPVIEAGRQERPLGNRGGPQPRGGCGKRGSSRDDEHRQDQAAVEDGLHPQARSQAGKNPQGA
jgi:hypothetical protein